MTGRISRAYLYIPFAVAGVLLAVWFAIWNVGAATMRAKLEKFAVDRAADGGEVSYSPLRTRGFPFYLRGSADGFTVSDGRNVYSCERLFIDALPYSPKRIIFSCGGAQTISTGGADWTVDARDLRASLERDDERGWLARIETGAAGMTDGAVQFSVENAVVNLTPREAGSEAMEAAMRVSRFTAADASRRQLVGRLDAAAVINDKEADASRLVDIVGFEAKLDDATFSANGHLRIASGEELTGRFDTRIENPAGVATTLANLKILKEKDAKFAGAALALLADASGGAITAPVELTTDSVAIAGIRIQRAEKRRQP